MSNAHEEVVQIIQQALAELTADPVHQEALVSDVEQANVNIINTTTRAHEAALLALADRIDRLGMA